MPRPRKVTGQTKVLDRSFWDKIPVESSRGMNPLVSLTEYLSKVFPGFEPGFFTSDDIEDRRAAEGYVVLTRAHWDTVSEWNAQVADRYALTEKNGALCWKDLYICVRPIDWGDRRRAQKNQESEDRYRAAKTGTPFRIQQKSAEGIGVGAVSKETSSTVDPEKFVESDTDEGEGVYSSKRS